MDRFVTAFAKLAYAPEEVRRGEKVEAEHGETVDWIRRHPHAPKKQIYRHIAKDHLDESGKYYTDLKTMEEFADKEKRAYENEARVIGSEKVVRKTEFQGIPIHIERPTGSTKTWEFKDGRPPKTMTYKHDYGFIPGVLDYDYEDLDVYLGPSKKAKRVYVAEKLFTNGTFDEHKVFLGFPDRKMALASAKYHTGSHFGKVHELSVDEFKKAIAGGEFEKRAAAGRYEVRGAILNCITNPEQFPLKVYERLPRDPWGAIVGTSRPLTPLELRAFHGAHQKDPDHSGVPYFFEVRDHSTGSTSVVYSDSLRHYPAATHEECRAAAQAGLSKGLKKEHVKFTPGLSFEKRAEEQVPIRPWMRDRLREGATSDGKVRPNIGLDDKDLLSRDLAKNAEAFLEKLGQVDPYQQETQWTCSAACLHAVLQHWGDDWPEHILVPLIGAKPKRGAETTEIAEAARMLGYLAFEYSFDSVQHARVLLDQDIPIICDIQSFNHPGKGHYVVMTKADETTVDLMDPNTPGNHRTLSIEEMEGRWWDHRMAPPHELMSCWGIVIVPAEEGQEKVALSVKVLQIPGLAAKFSQGGVGGTMIPPDHPVAGKLVELGWLPPNKTAVVVPTVEELLDVTHGNILLAKQLERNLKRHELTHWMRFKRHGNPADKPGIRNILRTFKEEVIARVQAMKPSWTRAGQAPEHALVSAVEAKSLLPYALSSTVTDYQGKKGLVRAALGGTLKPLGRLAQKLRFL